MSEPKAKVFTTGGSQAVRLPKAFRLEEGDLTVRRLGKGVVLCPKRQGGIELWAHLDATRDGETLPYPPQPVFQERDWKAIWGDAE